MGTEHHQYAAPLIRLARTRQADRDKMQSLAEAKHREHVAAQQTALLERKQELMEQVVRLIGQVHAATRAPKP